MIMMSGVGRIAFGGSLLLILACSADYAAPAAFSGSVMGRARLTSDIIPGSMVPSADLPLVDISTQKIPRGFTERGTSFYLGNDLWMSARHVVNDECQRIIMIVGGNNVEAHIKYLDENADVAILQASPGTSVPSLPLEKADAQITDMAYAFGFPQGTLGATSDQFLGRTKLKLGGFLSGTAPVLAWTELERNPSDFDSLAGISGGPVIDTNGYVIGVIVAASTRRGRNYTVAPEVLNDALRHTVGTEPLPDPVPARSVVTPPVSLPGSAQVLNKSKRIILTYCIPQG